MLTYSGVTPEGRVFDVHNTPLVMTLVERHNNGTAQVRSGR
jgi:hypothetical protein